MLTQQQKTLLALLKDFKCLRYSHVKSFMAANHGSTDEHLTKMLEQLSYMGRLKADADFVTLSGRSINPEYIKAFDVVMELTKGRVEFINPGLEPFTLMFSVKADTDTTNDFGVVIARRYCENRILKQLSLFGREIAVIFVLDEPEQQKLLKIENKCYYAIQDENNRYKFFKAVVQSRY